MVAECQGAGKIIDSTASLGDFSGQTFAQIEVIHLKLRSPAFSLLKCHGVELGERVRENEIARRQALKTV